MLRLIQGFDDPDLAYSDAQNRERGDDDGPTWVIEGLLPLGAFLLVADPGAGKSMIVQQILHHLCYGRPLGPWESQGGGGRRALVVDLEGDWQLNRDRSYSISPYRSLAQDGQADRDDHQLVYRHALIPDPQREAWKIWRTQHGRHIAYLDQLLTDQAGAGEPLDVVVIDTLTKFMGPRPANVNAYEHEAEVLGEINRLGLKHGCAIVVIHHTNKAGEVSGSTGILGSVTVGAKLELSPREDGCARGEAVLRSMKVRSGAPFAYPLAQMEDGTWSFVDDVTANQVVTAGQRRDVLDALARRPMNRMELLEAVGMPQSLGRVLQRLRCAGMIRSSFGRWQPVQTEAQRPGPTAPVEEVATPAPATPAETSTPVAPVEHVDQDHTRSAVTMLRDSIQASRMKPVLFIPPEQRLQDPWPRFAPMLDGRHRWTSSTVLPADHMVAVLDRNGSFPAACSSVPLAPNILHHTGALTERGNAAGLFYIKPIMWEDERIGHPLGRTADQPGPLWRVSTPQVALLEELAAKYGLEQCKPIIVDSWTGRGTGGLFSTFSRDVQTLRLATQGDEYAKVKATTSIALRLLWPVEARSPFWRPDWYVSVQAEAAVRHWIRAYQAVRKGATLLSMSYVDEVVFAAPPDATDQWAPEPYSIDPRRYGKVKHKDVELGSIQAGSPMQYQVWTQRKAPRRADRAR